MTMLNIDNGEAAAINYAVVKNSALSKRENKNVFCARVTAAAKSLREVAETMVENGSKYSAVEIYAILEAFADVVARLLKKGCAVNVGSLVRFRPSIRGRFETEADAFNPSEHRIVVKASVGSALRNVAANASVLRASSLPLPVLTAVYNAQNGELNTCASEGVIVVMGKHFIWDSTATDEGFFAIYDGTELACTLISLDDNRMTAFLEMPHMLNPGDEVELCFRTRNTSSGNLTMVNYGSKVIATTATAEV